MTKRCIDCGEVKDETSFHQFKQRGKLYRLSSCRLCHNDKMRKQRAAEWASMTPEQKRTRELRNKYGLSYERYLELLSRQDNKCAICASPFDCTPCVDHDHDTGAVRGLLCLLCNTGLGKFRDSPGLLMRGATYLKEHGRVDLQTAPGAL